MFYIESIIQNQNQLMLQFWGTFIVLTVLIFFGEKKFNMLRDPTDAKPQPYSWSRVQLAWWSIIILSSFIAIFLTSKDNQVPDLDQSTVILLAISGATSIAARMIDVSDMSNNIVRHQDCGSQGFLLDILSDNNGASVHRFQTIVFNLAFGCWFIVHVVNHIHAPLVNTIIPPITNENLLLLGLSSATYAAIKTAENKAGLAIPCSPSSPPVSPNPDVTPQGTTPATT
jgi:hypothetical protein